MLRLGLGLGLSLSQAAPAAGPALLPLNARLVHEGNSYPLASNTVGHAWVDQVMTFGRFRYGLGWHQAVAGQTMEQMADPAQRAAVLAAMPRVVLLDGPSNDLQGTRTAAEIMAFTEGNIDSELSGGVEYVVTTTTPPRWSTFALTAPRAAVKVVVDDAIRALHNSRGGRVKVVDFALAGLTEADTIAPGTDGIHLKWEGSFKVGPLIAAQLNSIIVPTNPLTEHLAADNLLVASDRTKFAGSGGTAGGAGAAQISGTIAAGWTVTNPAADLAIACSKIDDGGGLFAQRLIITGTASAAREVLLWITVARAGVAGDIDEVLAGVDLAAGSTGLKIMGVVTNPTNVSYPMRNTTAQFTFPAEALSGVLRSTQAQAYAGNTSSASMFISILLAAGPVNVDLTFRKPILRKLVAS